MDLEKIMLDNQEMKKKIGALNDSIHDFYDAYNDIISHMKTEQERVNGILYMLDEMQVTMNNLKYELSDPRKDIATYFYPQFRDNDETIRMIVDERKSLARFGDGEFAIAFNIHRHNFQRVDERLRKRIWEVVNADEDNLLIAIADNYGNLDRYNEQAAYHIRRYMTAETRKQHEMILPKDRVYSDAYITRAYVLYKDVFTDGPKRRFDALKRIWENKNIIIVEGAQTRLGVANDLFSNTNSLRRIIAPATNSFDRYDELLAESLKHADSADLFILAIGPSSGVLAYDLTVKGYQAVDVGHIDIEYEWFLAGEGKRVAVPGKYNNEVMGGDCVEMINDPLYEKQIIASFA